MYLVEIEAGREQLYESVDALAGAIRGGVIKPESRIFHRASSSWVSITVHPEYRKAIAARPLEPLPPPPRNQWTFFGSATPTRQIVEAVETSGTIKPAEEPTAEPAEPRGLRAIFGRRRRPQSPSPESTG